MSYCNGMRETFYQDFAASRRCRFHLKVTGYRFGLVVREDGQVVWFDIPRTLWHDLERVNYATGAKEFEVCGEWQTDRLPIFDWHVYPVRKEAQCSTAN